VLSIWTLFCQDGSGLWDEAVQTVKQRKNFVQFIVINKFMEWYIQKGSNKLSPARLRAVVPSSALFLVSVLQSVAR
jgi:hypothetical protein